MRVVPYEKILPIRKDTAKEFKLKDVDFKSHVNPESLTVIKAFVEPSLKTAKPFDNLQFQRLGYFVVDPDSTEKELVFNKTVGLRDTWAKQNN